ncbi:MAG TPA: tyrosine-type recombinase/integrase [Microvirga sp.]|jgi:integrase|nr:tyrosine-type recombinase/integrase [Microvirga sp.]
MQHFHPGHFDASLDRANQLDALAAVLPMNRRDALSRVLTNEDVATLRHLVEQGIGPNTLRALSSDLAYLTAWCWAATGAPLPWPAPLDLGLKFLAHHLWDPVRREADPHHGMPDAVAEELCSQGRLVAGGPHAPSTVRRRLAHWATLHRWRGLDAPFGQPQFKTALRLLVRSSRRPRQRKSERAVTADVLERLLLTCASLRLADGRDRAILLTGFASGGRRRSELAALRLEQIERMEPVRADPMDPGSPLVTCLKLRLGRTKTLNTDSNGHVLLLGRAADALLHWTEQAGIEQGPVFRAVDRGGRISDKGLTPQSVNLIVKRRTELAGLSSSDISAHGLRSGYLTEAARQGVSLVEAMQQSQHRSVQQAASYYNDANRSAGRAARVSL